MFAAKLLPSNHCGIGQLTGQITCSRRLFSKNIGADFRKEGFRSLRNLAYRLPCLENGGRRVDQRIGASFDRHQEGPSLLSH